MVVDLVRGRGPESRVRSVSVVPGEVEFELLLEGRETVRNLDESARALVLERPDASFNHSKAAVRTDGAEALPDAAASTPAPEPPGDELPALVGDEMPRLVTCHTNEPLHEPAHGIRGGLAWEYCEPHHAPRIVVDGDTHPPTERPDLGQGEGNPRNPEAERGGHAGEVDMPEVARPAGGDDARRDLRGRHRFMRSRRAQHPANRRRSEMQTRTGENPGDPDSPHGGAQDLQTADEVADEVGEAIHR